MVQYPKSGTHRIKIFRSFSIYLSKGSIGLAKEKTKCMIYVKNAFSLLNNIKADILDSSHNYLVVI